MSSHVADDTPSTIIPLTPASTRAIHHDTDSLINSSSPPSSSSFHHAPSHHSHSHALPLPSQDPSLNTLRLFWFLFWLLLAEFLYLATMVVNATGITYIAEHKQEEPKLPILGSEEEREKPEITPIITVLYFFPSAVVLLFGLVMLLSRKTNYLVRKLLLGVILLAIVVGLAGFIYALYHYIIAYEQRDECEEFEGWGVAVVRTLFVVLTLSPLAFRIGFAVALRADIMVYSQKEVQREESHFAKEPEMKGWLKVMSGFDKVIMLCCMPVCCKDEKNEHTKHVYQHVVQLIYEIILLVFALVEHKYIELMAIVAGLLGSLMGILHIYIADCVLNVFALLTGLFLLANSSAKIRCLGDEVSVKSWMYLIMFSLIATTIRFKSLLHTMVEGRLQIHHWLLDQLGWVANEINENESVGYAKSSKRFYQIRNFATLRKYGDSHEEEHKEEKKPIFANSKKGAVKNTKNQLLIALALLCGLAIIIAFSITMGIMYPQFKGGNHVKGIEGWRKTECQVIYSRSVYKSYQKYTYYYAVNTTEGEYLVAIPIETRYANPLLNRADDIKTRYSKIIQEKGSVPCRIAPDILWVSNYTSIQKLDYERKSPVWNRVSILGADSALESYQANFYVWVSVPPILIFFGLALCLSPFVVVAILKKRRVKI